MELLNNLSFENTEITRELKVGPSDLPMKQHLCSCLTYEEFLRSSPEHNKNWLQHVTAAWKWMQLQRVRKQHGDVYLIHSWLCVGNGRQEPLRWNIFVFDCK